MKNLSGFPKVLGQRAIYRVVREAVDLLSDPVAMSGEPFRVERVMRQLKLVFETCPRDRVFSPYVRNQLGKKKGPVLEAAYHEWQKTRAAS